MSSTGRRPTQAATPPSVEVKKTKEKTALASDALRREAELRWAQSERSANHRQRRGQAKSRARAQRRQSDAELKAEIARLTKKLAETERELTKLISARKKSAK